MVLDIGKYIAQARSTRRMSSVVSTHLYLRHVQDAAFQNANVAEDWSRLWHHGTMETIKVFIPVSLERLSIVDSPLAPLGSHGG